MKFLHPGVRLTNQKPRAFVSVRQTNQIAVFPFVCCFCFVCAFSFQGHTKIALLLFLLMFGSKAMYTSKTSSSVYAEVIRYLLLRYLLFTVKPGQSFRGRTKIEHDCFNTGFIIGFNFALFR